MPEQKTNAMRILDQLGIRYRTTDYEENDCPVSGKELAEKIDVPEGLIFKTLVTQGKSERYYVFVISAADEMDLKKAARSVGEKSVRLVPVKDISQITGYVRGGCSPIGMRRSFKTIIDISAKDLENIYVSGGRVGCTISVNPVDLAKAADARFEDIVLRKDG